MTTTSTPSTEAAAPAADGADILAFASQLYPICRSITGAGVRTTLDLISRRLPLEITAVPSGTPVFDWEVPEEWNIEGGWIRDRDGQTVVDFADHNLHVVSYSEPMQGKVSRAELERHLHSLPEHPEWTPYRTSYYRRTWGFCLPHAKRMALSDHSDYEVRMDSRLARGVLNFGECVLPGERAEEIVLYTHTCHPSLANDNASGMAVATWLGQWLAGRSRRFTWRLVFGPGTIGSLCWLKLNESRLGQIRHGLVTCLLGDQQPLTYKRSRRADRRIDHVITEALRQASLTFRDVPFEPYGYDERQFCSPGFDLPFGRLTRAVNSGYPGYHSSADDLSILSATSLAESLRALQHIVEALESDVRYLNLLPKGEPRLGKRGLYGGTGGNSPAERERAFLWLLNQSDGRTSMFDVAVKSGLPTKLLAECAAELERSGLLGNCDENLRAE
jgi:aminopeptidase-like protein